MGQLLKSDRLKDKFSKLEFALNDDELTHKLTDESIKNIKPVLKVNKNISFVNIILRSARLVANYFNEIIKTYFDNVIKKAITSIYNHSVIIAQEIRKKEENIEILLDKKINFLEAEKKEKKESEELKNLNLNLMVEEYYSAIQVLFFELVDSNDYKVSDESFDCINSVNSPQLKLMGLISRKLIVSNMIANVASISIKTRAEGNDIINIISMEMKKNGFLWAKMFGRRIVPELNKIFEKNQCKISIKQVYNVTAMKDVFHLRVNYRLPLESKKETLVGARQVHELYKEKKINEYDL
jgi:hypothetical protein